MFFGRLFPSVFLAAAASTLATSAAAAATAFNAQTAATTYVAQQWGVTAYYDVFFDSSITGNNGTFAFLRQQANELPVLNSYAVVQFDKNGNVVHFSGKYFPLQYIEDDMPGITPQAAVTAAQNALGGTWDGVTPTYGYIAGSNQRLYFNFVLHVTTGSQVYEAYIDAVSGQLTQVINTATKAALTTF